MRAPDDTSCLKGKIDEVSIYDRALLPDQIYSHCQQAGVLP